MKSETVDIKTMPRFVVCPKCGHKGLQKTHWDGHIDVTCPACGWTLRRYVT